MYTDNNGVVYKLKGNKAIISSKFNAKKIEIFPTITINDEVYEVRFPNNCSNLFIFNNVEEFTLHKLLHPTTNVKTCDNMFYRCEKLKKLDLTNFNTENVFNMVNMFHNCNNLEELNISSFNTKNVFYMGGMFSECGKLKKIYANFNTKNVIDIEYMFYRCYELKQVDLSNFNGIFNNMNVSNVEILANYNTKNKYYIHCENVYLYDINCNNKYQSYIPVFDISNHR